VRGTKLRRESQLLLLFGFCHSYKTGNPKVDVDQVGTEAVVTSTCLNPKCPNPKSTWHSQPTMPGTKLPAGNFLLGSWDISLQKCLQSLLTWVLASYLSTLSSYMSIEKTAVHSFCFSLLVSYEHGDSFTVSVHEVV